MTWRLPTACGLAGLCVGAGAVWWLRPVPVRVEVQERVRVEWRDREVVREVAGPVRVVERRVEVPGPAGPTVTITRVEDRGPVVVDREVVREGAVRVETRLVSVPAVRPSWALSGGVQLLPDVRAELGLEHRLLGPVWVRAWALQPLAVAAPAVGVGLRVEF